MLGSEVAGESELRRRNVDRSQEEKADTSGAPGDPPMHTARSAQPAPQQQQARRGNIVVDGVRNVLFFAAIYWITTNTLWSAHGERWCHVLHAKCLESPCS